MATFTIVLLFVIAAMMLVAAAASDEEFLVKFIQIYIAVACLVSGIWMVMK
jgi:hypothetical protein